MSQMRPRQQLLSTAEKGFLPFEEFFTSLQIGTNESFLSVQGNKKIKTNKLISYLFEILQELSHREATDLWNNVKEICVEALRIFANRVSGEDQENNHEHEVELNKVCTFFENVASLCLAAIKLEDVVISDGLFGTALLLHGSLLNMCEVSPNLSKKICKLCIEWWLSSLPGKNDLCLNVLVHLLSEMLRSGLTDKIGRCSTSISEISQLQNALKIFDFSEDGYDNKENSEPVQELRQILISCFLHPAFLKGINGRKFLSNVLLLHEDMMKVIHGTIISHIISSPNNKHSEAYGNIYYLAWNLAEESFKEKLEEVSIQDIMFRAIHASHEPKSPSLFDAYRAVLFGITCHKATLQVSHMLTKLFAPIIWRSLKAVNAMVRANSATLLFDAFPLREPVDVTGNDRDELLQRQFTAFDDLIMDTYPQIRSIAVLGICEILNLYWDVIPADVIAVQARNLYTNLAFDSTSVSVRVAVFKGTIILLNNPCSHLLLQKLLPIIGTCLHDANEKVRVEVINVLLAVKQTSSILFWNICPIENILAQLEVENRTGTNKLVKLLSGSFLPSSQPVQNWVERCVNFHSRNTAAARKFYLHALKPLTPGETGEFVFMLSMFVFNHVKKSLKEDVENEDVENENLPNVTAGSHSEIVDDLNVMAGLLETICIVWLNFSKNIKSVSRKSESEKVARSNNDMRQLSKRVMINLPRMLHLCFKKFNDERNLHAMLQLSSTLEPGSMPIFSKKVFPKLEALPDDVSCSYYSMLIHCMVKWGWAQQLVELISLWLTTSAPPDKTSNDQSKKSESNTAHKSSRNPNSKRSEKKGKVKSVQFTVVEKERRPAQALKYLSCILDDEELSNSILKNNQCQPAINNIVLYLQSYVNHLMLHVQGNTLTIPLWTPVMLTKAFDVLFKLLGNLYSVNSHLDNDVCDASLQRLVNLIECTLVELVGQLKISAQAFESQNTSILSVNLSQCGDQSISQNQTSNLLRRVAFARQCFDIAFPAIIKLLKYGVPVAKDALFFLSTFTETGLKTIDYAGDISELFLQLYNWFLLFVWSEKDDQSSNVVDYENETTLFKVFDDLLVALMLYSRKNPDGFHQLFRTNIRSRVRSFLQILFEFSGNLTKNSYEFIARKIISSILADIVHHTSASQFHLREKVSDLPQYCACLLPLLCATSSESGHVCRHVIPSIFSQEELDPLDSTQRNIPFQAVVILLHALVKDSNNSSSARDCLEKLKKENEEFMKSAETLNQTSL